MEWSLRRLSANTDSVITSEESVMDRERGACEEMKRGARKEGDIVREGDGLGVKKDGVRRDSGRDEARAIKDEKIMRGKRVVPKAAELWF